MKPTIVLTMGDPAGVGPEVIVKALADPAIAPLANWIVCGDSRVSRAGRTSHRQTSSNPRKSAISPLSNLSNDFQFGKLDAQLRSRRRRIRPRRHRDVPRREKPTPWSPHRSTKKPSPSPDAPSPATPNTSPSCADRRSRACCWPASGSPLSTSRLTCRSARPATSSRTASPAPSNSATKP